MRVNWACPECDAEHYSIVNTLTFTEAQSGILVQTFCDVERGGCGKPYMVRPIISVSYDLFRPTLVCLQWPSVKDEKL